MEIFNYFITWLGFLGVLAGILAAAFFDMSPLRAGIGGLVTGIVPVIVINSVSATPAPCLQQSKGLDILRAYYLKCPDPNAGLRK